MDRISGFGPADRGSIPRKLIRMDDLYKVRDYVKFVEENGIDLSKIYDHHISESKNFYVQDSIMRSTRMIFSMWDLIYRVDTKEILYLFKDIKDKFGNHPFHHILEGRIAGVVKMAYKEKIPVPPEFIDDYLYFQFALWNDPHLHYHTLEDLRTKKPEAVPPEFRN